MTLQTFHLLSLALGIFAFTALTVFCIVTWARKITGRAAFTASLATLLFLLSHALTGVGPITFTLQVIALLAWMVLLVRVIGLGPRSVRRPELKAVVGVAAGALVAGLTVVGSAWVLTIAEPGGVVSILFAAEVLFAIAGLVLLEQVVRNTREDLRGRLRFLNIGVGTMFMFQLIHGATALLLNGYMPSLVAAQPAIYALAAPFIAVASLRNPDKPLRLNLSREFVFRSGTLIATGVLLLLLGALGYLVRLLDGSWGAATLALLMAIAGMATVTVFTAPTVRLRGRQWLEENLFPRKHDYRGTWQRVTQQLTEPSADFDLAQQVIRTLGSVLGSPGGGLWRLSQQGLLIPIGQLHTDWTEPLSPGFSRAVKTRFEADDSIMDLRNPPPALGEQVVPEASTALARARFIVPLMVGHRLFGIAVLNDPPVSRVLTWEDDDVLKLIARQAAGFAALQEAERELAEADKLNSFSQVSAFIVHDVKTIAAQLSLLVENAPRHRDNPEFVDDMVETVGHAVARMTRLLEQLRGEADAPAETVDLAAMLEQTLGGFVHHDPKPDLTVSGNGHTVAADAGKLRSAVSHLLQNAVDAASCRRPDADCEPHVQVKLRRNHPWVEIAVEDNGAGMDQTFIDQSLFQPFTSTKGVAGMGVGAYQARSYVRSLGGDISVRSRPGDGAVFTIKLPIPDNHD